MPTRMKQLNVSLTPHFARLIRGKVKSGRYSNASEVVREALRRFEHDEEIGRREDLLEPENAVEEVAHGFDAIERGEFIDVDGDLELQRFFAEIAVRGKQRLGVRNRTAHK